MSDTGTQDPSSEPTPGQTPPPASSTPPATAGISQEEVDRIAGQARTEGRSAAEKALLEQLGVSDLDAAKEALRVAKEVEDAKKSETERLQEQIKTLEEEKDRIASGALEALTNSKIELALKDAGIKTERLAAALRLADKSLIKSDGGEIEGVSEVVSGIKNESPEWFGASLTAPDASGGSSSSTDFRSADAQTVKRELAKLNINV